jgi:hypothetical protein
MNAADEELEACSSPSRGGAAVQFTDEPELSGRLTENRA